MADNWGAFVLKGRAVDPDVASVIEHPWFCSFIEHLPCVLCVMQPTWPPAIEFISANVERFLGYAPKDFYADRELGLRCIHLEDRERVAEQMRRAMASAAPYRMEYRAVHRAGSPVYHAGEVSVPVADSAGRVVRRQSIIMDITEQKRLEAELLRSQRLAVVGEMTTMMAHQIRNPLAGMALALRALERLVGGNAEGRECLADLDHCLVRINDTVSRLLDFARARPPVLRKCRLADIVANARQLAASHARRHAIEFQVSLPPDLPDLVADPAQLEQVLVHLILNACKAMPSGGRLTLCAHGEPGRVVITVADTGVGIPPEDLGRLFSPFYSGTGQGVGLGLSLCERLVAAHDGSIRVQSAPGQGTTFRIELPLEPAHAARIDR
ncbi:MAG TPA: ATP-binding protein [Planctomycetota bacterium]|nr:ATP-binding protein [Planctomycetota bacterium]HRT93044.1 ATP-binding protein [Planctomycetota bacterium]